MTIELVDAYANGRSAATGNVALASGRDGIAGDVCLVALLFRKHMTMTIPAGWTELSDSPYDDHQSSTSMRVRVFWRLLDGTETNTDFVFGGPTSADPAPRASGARVTYRGSAGVARWTHGTAGTTDVAPTGTLTNAAAGARWVTFSCGGLGADPNVHAPPAPMVSRAYARDGSGSSPNLPVRVSDDTPAPGSSGHRDVTVSTSDGQNPANGAVGVLIELVAANIPPDAPTLLHPVDGQHVDLASDIRFQWQFSDPDPGDTQSAYQIQIRPAADPDPTVDVYNETPDQHHDLDANTLALGEHEWRAKTWDAEGAEGPWSPWEPFVVDVATQLPTIVDPVVDQTIDADTHIVNWSSPEQEQYQIRRVADDNGDPDPTVIYHDTGPIISTTARHRTVAFPDNQQWEHVQLRVARSGLWSDWVTVRVHVNYTPPAEPTATVTVHQADGVDAALAVMADHPAPEGDEPQVVAQDVERRVPGQPGIRVAAEVPPDAPYIDWTVASDATYEYRVRARGINGASSWSPWTG